MNKKGGIGLVLLYFMTWVVWLGGWMFYDLADYSVTSITDKLYSKVNKSFGDINNIDVWMDTYGEYNSIKANRKSITFWVVTFVIIILQIMGAYRYKAQQSVIRR